MNKNNTIQKSIKCAYHEEQWITNFCDDQNCLMPLCPKCLAIHSQEHKKNKTYGSFQSIDDTIIKVTSMLKTKIDTLKNLQSKNEKTTQSSSELTQSLLKQINALENKCMKLCQEMQYKMQNTLKTETTDLEKKIREQEEYLEGIERKDKCLMSIIKALKSHYLDHTNPNYSKNAKNDSISSPSLPSAYNLVSLKVDFDKIQQISDSLHGYAKLIQHQVKKQVTFNENGLSNKSVSQVDEDSKSSISFNKQNNEESFESPTQFTVKNSKQQQDNKTLRNGNEKEEEEENDDNENIENSNNKQNNDVNDIYAINDPDIIRLRQRREERRIRAELREIGMKKQTNSLLSPKNQKNNSNQNNNKNQKKTLDSREPIIEPSSNFVTFERPQKSQLNKYAKPEELQFLEMVQERSAKMQEEFERQQNDIYLNAINYQVPTNQSRPYKPLNLALQQNSSLTDISSPATLNHLSTKSNSYSQKDISSPLQIRQPMYNQTQQQFQQQNDQRSPLQSISDRNTYNYQAGMSQQYQGYSNGMTSLDKISQVSSPSKSNLNSNNIKYQYDSSNGGSMQLSQPAHQQQWSNTNRPIF